MQDRWEFQYHLWINIIQNNFEIITAIGRGLIDNNMVDETGGSYLTRVGNLNKFNRIIIRHKKLQGDVKE